MAAVQVRADAFDVHRDLSDRAPSDGHESLFAPFAEHPRNPFLEEEVLQLHADQLRNARARRVREFQQRVIADTQRLVRIGGFEQLLHLGDAQDRRQGSPPFGRFDPLARIARGEALADEKPEVGADRGYLPSDRRGREAEVLEEVDELAQLCRRELLGGPHAPARGIHGEARDVAQIVLHRVTTVARLQREVVPEALELEGSAYWIGGRRSRRRASHMTIMRMSAPATMARTVFTRRSIASTTSRSVPSRWMR